VQEEKQGALFVHRKLVMKPSIELAEFHFLVIERSAKVGGRAWRRAPPCFPRLSFNRSSHDPLSTKGWLSYQAAVPFGVPCSGNA
jgi:hypothetical protein